MTFSTPPTTPTLISIGTHSLALYTHGPEPSNPQAPIILFISGIASSSLNWAAVIRLLSPSLRSYTYDRAGYGRSELSPLAPTAETIALELSLLIKHTPLSNPLIIVGHSWAGVLIHEFIALTGNGPHISGLVFVDANHENALEVLNPNNVNLAAMSVGLDAYVAYGIEAEHKLTAEEWDAFMSDEATGKHKQQEQKEESEYAPSFETLRKKELGMRQPLLEGKPVHVIGGMRSRDWSGLYRAGVERGNGSEEQRRCVRQLIETADKKSTGLMKEFLKLSTKGKLVFARESGHFVQLTEPEMVVDGVKWVLNESQISS
ncbi:alpha/beta hydrolase [Sclerotinia borealis F-4128]|uniref:Alpha/beta hydrolase n=1 Tax=Sclerotinia borealis (strain F-4128) TaxID=1432307 RepID=W9C6M7_SCLBF|nr:alpha/beta hydrolase [Sclerotinia borealis F-4128]